MILRTAYFGLLLTALLAIVGCALLPSSSSRSVPQSLSGPTPTLVPTPIVPTKPVYEVQQGEVVRTVQFLGRVAPTLEKEMYFRTNGRIRNFFVKRDDMVSSGQLLADLEIDDLERALATAKLDLERAEQELAKAEQKRRDDLSRTKLNLELALANLTQEEQERFDDITQSRLELAIKRLQLSRAKTQEPGPRETLASAALIESGNALRQAQLAYNEIAYADDIGSSSQAIALEKATLAYEMAQATFELAKQQIESYDYDLELLAQEISLAELDLERLQAAGSNPQLELRISQAQLEVDILERGPDPLLSNNVDRARLKVQDLEAEIGDAQIIAPFDGKILSVSLSEGREVEGFKPIIILADPTDLEVSADPRDTQLTELTEDMPVVAEFSSRPGVQIFGHIRKLPYPYGSGGRSEELEEEDKTTRITLDTSLAEAGLDLGDLMQIKVVVEQKDGVLWLPPQAIRTFESRTFVVIQEGEAQQRLDVKIGVESEDRVEIEAGLELGQRVIGP